MRIVEQAATDGIMLPQQCAWFELQPEHLMQRIAVMKREAGMSDE